MPGQMKEINRGYIDYLRPSPAPVTTRPAVRESQAVPASVSIGPRPSSSVWTTYVRPVGKALGLGHAARFAGRAGRATANAVWHVASETPRYAVFALLAGLACCLAAFLRIRTLFRGKLGAIHEDALPLVEQFVEQYPFNFYPVVVKSLELAYLKRQLRKHASTSSRIVELAIGDGTLSRRIYPNGIRVVGVDISPFSLRHSGRMPHVREAVIGDCLVPPIRDGSFDLLVTNNFLHHVSAKSETLDRLSRIARISIFNENSEYWLSAWPVPFLLRAFGFGAQADAAIQKMSQHLLQDCWPRDSIDDVVRESFDIVETQSFANKWTFFFCGVFSRIMGCYGPPTPPRYKELFLSRYGKLVALPLTRMVAKLLIEFDAGQDRRTDVFISYTGESRSYRPASDDVSFLACPDCRATLTGDRRCSKCNRQFNQVDGMWFVLPRELSFIETNYSPEIERYQPGVANSHH